MEVTTKSFDRPSPAKKHKVEIDYKESVRITGVADVPVFSDKNVTVRLADETLYITGQGLSIKTLDIENGVLVLSGQVYSLKYAGQTTPSSVIKRIFK